MNFDENATEDWYKKHYSQINVSGNVSSYSHKMMHKLMERDRPKASQVNQKPVILEIGANKGEHAKFVKDDWERYVATDIRIPAKEDLEQMYLAKVEFEQADAMALPFLDSSFDRVIVSCVLHHLAHPEDALLEIKRVLRYSGYATILLPHDPGAAYRLVWRMTTLRRAKRMHLEARARYTHALEHKNNYLSIRTLVLSSFQGYKIIERQFPLPWKSYDFNLLSVFHLGPRDMRC